MMIQGLMDFFSLWLAGLVSLIPPVPAEWSESVGMLSDGGVYLGGKLALLSPVIPWSVFGACLAIWFGLVQFWAAMLGIRFVLWIVGR